MKRLETSLALRRIFAGAALVIAITAGLYGEARLGLQPQSSEKQCASAAASAQEQSNLAAEAPDPNAPMTRAEGAAILREIRAIRLLLENGGAPRFGARRPAAPHNVRMRVEPGWYGLGRADAPVTIVEFADLQCPFCRRFQTTTFAEIKKDYIDTGKVRFIARDLPLPMHAYALGAADAARCAGDQGKFWQFRDAVLDDQASPTPDVLLKHARGLGLNLKQFQTCLTGRKYEQQVQADGGDAAAAGIRGTPAFVIGRDDGGWIEGLAVQGARPFPFFQQAIEKMLNEPSPGSVKMRPAGMASPSQGSGLAGSR